MRSLIGSVFAAVGCHSRRSPSPVAMFVISLLTMVPLVAQSASIDISQAIIQARVEKAFPKEVAYPKGIGPLRAAVEAKLSAPQITLEGATELVVLCGRWALTIKASAYPKDLDMNSQTVREDGGRFCAESRLKWNKETGTVTVTQVRIRRFTLGDEKAVPPPLLTVLNALVPPELEGVVVYTAPKFIGWAIKDLKVLDGRLRIDF